MKLESFSKKQLQVLTWWCDTSPHKDKSAVICDGAVRSGKTSCMALSFVAWACCRFDDSSFAFCGKTIRSLKRNLITPLLPVLKEAGFLCRLRLADNLMEVSCGRHRNRFYFFGGKDAGSASLIQGMTLSGVLFDEVALMPRAFVEQALARCSVEGSTFWFNCNPESPQHWFYREWILGAKQKRALYLHFRMEDNPSLSPEMLARYQNLYAGTFYQRFVEGKWVSSQGLVYPFLTGDSYCPVPEGPFSDYIISCDYGTVNPASFGLWGKLDSTWYRLEEYYYNSRLDGVQRTDEEHYTGLRQLAGDRPISRVIVDPSAASFMAVIRQHGEFTPVPARNDVLDGIRLVSVALKQGRIKICDTCIDSIREFGLYRWRDDLSRDTPVKENDHAMDDIRYFVTTALYAEDGGCFAIAAKRR
ncbi:MAG: PBSX family phage terminase large subunit [Oscillospiraceae bacterium]|nr:PBSX family phage terminase large subunit [Oscillospiraceae bacterium]